jgi:hypothetical protein
MLDLVSRAIAAHRESKRVEFKQSFDPSSPRELCELAKDMVAIANSGGGVVVFGLDSVGMPTGESTDSVMAIDPADMLNRIAKYTGPVDFEFQTLSLEKEGHRLAAFLIEPVSIPLVFEKPGTYDVGGGKQNSVFSVGTVYFRHGAKSEPGTSDDLRAALERQLEKVRKSWVRGVRKVVQAPVGSQIVAVTPTAGDSKPAVAAQIRAVNDPNAAPVRLTRDPTAAAGLLVYEEISDGIFDEINNVVDANRVLARGRMAFYLGQPVYYRVYAERHHVNQHQDSTLLLLHSGVQFYAPALFWSLGLPETFLADILAGLYSRPISPSIHFLTRTAFLLGPEFCAWLLSKWDAKWEHEALPPAFYSTFKRMVSGSSQLDGRLLAARVSPEKTLSMDQDLQIEVKDAFEKPDSVIEGNNDSRGIARSLDYLAYGHEIQQRASAIAEAAIHGVERLSSTHIEAEAATAELGPDGD